MRLPFLSFCMQQQYKKYAAEFLGTFALSFAVLWSVNGANPWLMTSVLAGTVVGVFVYTVGNISGTHLNPAVTVAMWSAKKIKPKDAACYIAAQIIGAELAMFAAGVPALQAMNSPMAFVGEALGAFVLLFGISSVVFGKVHSAASGIVIGGSLFLGIILASPYSSGVLNPAVALALGPLSVMYYLGPIIGGLLGVWCYKWLVD